MVRLKLLDWVVGEVRGKYLQCFPCCLPNVPPRLLRHFLGLREPHRAQQETPPYPVAFGWFRLNHEIILVYMGCVLCCGVRSRGWGKVYVRRNEKREGPSIA